MTCLKTTFYRFECDEADCPNSVEYEASNQQAAVREARNDGWASHPEGDRCPEHNRKRLPTCPDCGTTLLDPERAVTTSVCPECGTTAEVEA